MSKIKIRKENFVKRYRENGGKVAEACLSIGLPISTYHSWHRKESHQYDPKFAEAIEQIDLEMVERVEAQVWKKIDDGNDQWMVRWLTHGPGKTITPGRWTPAEQSGPIAIAHDGKIELTINRKVE